MITFTNYTAIHPSTAATELLSVNVLNVYIVSTLKTSPRPTRIITWRPSSPTAFASGADYEECH